MAGTFRPGVATVSPLQRAVAVVPPPDGFAWEPEFDVLRVGGAYATTFNPGDWVQGATFHCAPGGSGDGSSPSSPLGSPGEAISAINAAGLLSARIVLAPGRYTRGWGAARASTEHLSVTCPTGVAIVTAGDQNSPGGSGWEPAGGSSVVWTTSRSSGTSFVADGVFDRANADVFGFAQRLTPVVGVSEVESTPNSAFVDAGGVLHVHLFDGREPDSAVYAALDEDAAGHSSGSLFVQNVSFWGGRRAFAGQVGAGERFVFRNSEFLYSGDYDTLEVAGGGLLALLDCTTAHSGRDGFNYDGNISVLEDGCRSFMNGLHGSANNASTLHDNARAIRINGRYGGSQHRTVHDVHSSESWNVACRIEAPFGSGSTTFSVGAGFGTHTDRNTRVWLEACEVDGEGYAAEGCQLLVRRTIVTPMVLGSAEPY